MSAEVLELGSVLLSPEEARSVVRLFQRESVTDADVSSDGSLAAAVVKLAEAAGESGVQHGVFVSMEGLSAFLNLVHRVGQFASEFDAENCDFLKTRRMWGRTRRALVDADAAVSEITARFATELEGADV